MITPKQAPVRPRVTLPGVEGESLLEDAVRARLDAEDWGIIELIGTSGSGKSTSLGHLAHVFAADPRLTLADQPDATNTAKLLTPAAHRLAICASPSRRCKELYRIAERWRLARWSDDDCIEYLLAVHPEHCASVMRRIQADPRRRPLAGLPELWRIALDQLAANECMADVNVALRHEALATVSKGCRVFSCRTLVFQSVMPSRTSKSASGAVGAMGGHR